MNQRGFMPAPELQALKVALAKRERGEKLDDHEDYLLLDHATELDDAPKQMQADLGKKK